MIFFPNRIYDNKGESKVWEELKASFSDIDGFALNKANLYFGGKSWFQPDIILASPYFGILLIEVKGCKIEDVEQVTLGSWSMSKSFYADEINPLNQVQNQKIRLNEILDSKGIQLPKNAVKHCVALPLITKEAWDGKGFANENQDRLIKFASAEDKKPLELGSPKISRDLWLKICKLFGVKPLQNLDYEKRNEGLLEKPKRTSFGNGKLVCVPYSGYAPHKEATIKHIQNTVNHSELNTYLVATSGLERLRSREAPGSPEQKGNLLFDKAINQFMGQEVLSKTDTIILLRRIIDAEFSDDEVRRKQLNADVYELYDKMLELDSAEIDLSNSYIRKEAKCSWTSNTSFELFSHLKSQLDKALSDHDKHSFSCTSTKAILQWIKEDYVPHPTIIMEGFTRITPIQKQYIDRCLEFGSTVVFIYSYDENQAWGFSNQDHIVSAFENVDTEVLPFNELPLDKFFELGSLKGELFSLENIIKNKVRSEPDSYCYSSKDGTVTATEYNFISQEIDSVCESIKKQVAINGNGQKKIAIVTRDLGTYAPLFISKLQNDPQLSQYLDLPQRKLLQTPFGRFILSLYKIWDHDNERLFMDSDTFSDIIASGWLGINLRESLASFEFIKPLFKHCETLNQWHKVLTRPYDIPHDESSRFPLASLINPTELFKQWNGALQQLHKVCERIFDKGKGNLDIAQHISLLEQELVRFLEDNPVSGIESTLLKQLKTVFKELENTESITLSHQEFGSIINSLTKTEEQMTDEHDNNWEHDKTQIKIVMPESIDGLMTNGSNGYDIVYYVGADNQRLPKRPSQDWLFDRKALLGDLEVNDSNKFERYLFLSVFRSAKEQFHLSYSCFDGSQTNGKSTYYTMLADRLLAKTNEETGSVCTPWNWSKETNVLPNHQLKSASLVDLMVFSLCPYRYLLENSSHRARCYKTEWQLTLYSGSQWKEGILKESSIREIDIDSQSLISLKEEIWKKYIKPYYPYITKLEFDTRDNYLNFSKLEDYSKFYPDRRYKSRSLGEGYSLDIPVSQFFWGDLSSGGEYSRKLEQTVVSNEFLLPVSKNGDNKKGKYQLKAQNILFDALKKVKRDMCPEDQAFFRDEILNMSKKAIKKQPGNHCKYCPSVRLCLSVTSEED
ncbi:nuclease-like protein [Vibrio crassostreae]|uniref:nuclease-related domain-containing protein n=1 Tax=Vibrio crassostreae TaxID=246167 RepID=UPI000F4E5A2D|nr:nuclease-related domain-containing protein [Vibrio crassostreae]RPF10202.1 nuclease-like protein [Vibrio crassostreae]